MKKYVLLLAFLLCPSLKSADVGIGISWQANGNMIYVPVELNTNIRLEGLLGYQKNSRTADGHNFVHRDTSIGIGAFWKSDISESVKMYLGSRFAYSRTTMNNYMYLDMYQNLTQPEQKSNGFGISPTFGFEYFPVKNISIGGEAGLSYARQHESYGYTGDGSATKSYRWNTVSAVVLRMYF